MVLSKIQLSIDSISTEIPRFKMTSKVHTNNDKSLFNVNSLNLKSIAVSLSLEEYEIRGIICVQEGVLKPSAHKCVCYFYHLVTYFSY